MKIAEPGKVHWTRKDYYKMARSGLFDNRRVELIRGEIFEITPQESRHATAVSLVDYPLRPLFGKGFVIRIQLPLSLGQDSEPEPDVAVVAGALRDFSREHPRSCVLVIEVAEASLAYDRDTKSSLYAEAGLKDYWIVNLVEHQLEVYRDPGKDPHRSGGHGFRSKTILSARETISPLALGRTSLKVSDLLP